MTTSTMRIVPEHYQDLCEQVLEDFYVECHALDDKSSCFNIEDREETWRDAQEILGAYILEIGDAVGMTAVDEGYTMNQRIKAFGLVSYFAGGPNGMNRLRLGEVTFKDKI